jgi:transcriptional regulator with XRE-family HTH domain
MAELADAKAMPARRGRRGRRAGPHPVDVHVGSRVRMRRTLLGMSQEKLGDALALTFQQVQKYERGANRVGASRLYEISQILDVPVSFFFEEMSPETATLSPHAVAPTGGEGSEELERDPLAKRETLELVRAYYRIVDPRVRKRMFGLTKAVASSSDMA